jgi:RNA-splicing ligase RtcB
VLIGGSMGTGSYILVGEASAEDKAFSSACHRAGRPLSRHAALKRWSGRKIIDELASQGILIRSLSRPAASPRRRLGPIRTSAQWWPPPSMPAWPEGSPG